MNLAWEIKRWLKPLTTPMINHWRIPMESLFEIFSRFVILCFRHTSHFFPILLSDCFSYGPTWHGVSSIIGVEFCWCIRTCVSIPGQSMSPQQRIDGYSSLAVERDVGPCVEYVLNVKQNHLVLPWRWFGSGGNYSLISSKREWIHSLSL